jgi:hypothetical protein
VPIIPWRRLAAALVALLTLAPQALVFVRLAQARPVTCGCAARSCCCAPRKAGAKRLPCHGTAPAAPGTPAWRCSHGAAPVWVAADPAVLPVPGIAIDRPAVEPAWRSCRVTTLAGFARLDLPPPRLASLA